MSRTIAKASEEFEKLKVYMAELKDGEEYGYDQICEDTGVVMNHKGKALLRRAAKAMNREYACIPGYGIQMASAATAMTMVTSRLRKINGAVKRAKRTHEIVCTSFLSEMNEDDQQRCRFVGGIFAAIQLASEQAKPILKKAISDPPRIMIPIVT